MRDSEFQIIEFNVVITFDFQAQFHKTIKEVAFKFLPESQSLVCK